MCVDGCLHVFVGGVLVHTFMKTSTAYNSVATLCVWVVLHRHVPPGISDPPQQLPEVQHLQSLSISRDAITAAAFSATGESKTSYFLLPFCSFTVVC